jgi:hypothetical protein
MAAANMKPRATSPAPQGPGPASTRSGALDDALGNTFPGSDPVSMLEPAGASPERPVVSPTVGARQAVTGHNVRYVLGFGLAGVIVAFVIIYLIYNA